MMSDSFLSCFCFLGNYNHYDNKDKGHPYGNNIMFTHLFVINNNITKMLVY